MAGPGYMPLGLVMNCASRVLRSLRDLGLLSISSLSILSNWFLAVKVDCIFLSETSTLLLKPQACSDCLLLLNAFGRLCNPYP